MAQHRLTAILELKDRLTSRLSQAIDRMNRQRRATEQARDSLGRFTSQAQRSTSAMSRLGSIGRSAFDSLRTGAGSFMGSLGGVAAAVGGIGLAVAGIKATLGGAMKLEQEQISMEHFIGLSNPKDQAKKMTDEYMAYLRQNANLTPFETGDVISGGRRMINVTNGDIGQAKKLLTVAENMAALNPGKSLMDAAEALADMKNGETERMKEFGFKISADDLKAAGGGDAVAGAMKIMMTDVAKTFEGGAEKLGASSAGLLSTITGSMSSAMTDMGIGALEKLKPALKEIADFSSGPGIQKMVDMGSSALAGAANGVIWLLGAVKKVIPYLVSVKNFFVEYSEFTGPLVRGLAAVVAGFLMFQGAIKIFNMLRIAMLFLTGPIGLILAALTVLYAAWDGNWFGFRDTIMNVFNQIKPYIAQAMTFIMGLFTKVQSWFASNGPGIFAGIMKAVNGVMNFFKAIPWKAIFDVLSNAVMQVVNVIKGVNWSGIFGALVQIAMTVWGVMQQVWPMIANIVMSAISIIMSIIQFAWPIIVQIFQWAWAIIQTIIMEVLPPIVAFIGQAITFVIGVFQSLFNYIAVIMPMILQIISFVWSIIGPLIEFWVVYIWNIVKIAFTLIWGIISMVFTLIWNIISTVFGVIGGIFKAFLQFVTGDFSGAFTTLWETVKGVFTGIGKTISDFVGGAMDVGKNFINGIVDGFLAVWDKVKETASKIWDSITSIFGKKQTVPVDVQDPTGGGTPSGGGGSSKSHAAGIEYVPYDGYQATLHKGERVLTSGQNDSRSGGGSGIGNVTIAKLADQIIVREDADIEKIAAALARKLQEAGGLMA